ncbi:MAG: M36 family metallopeptidase [Saprospiraceae bacterium]
MTKIKSILLIINILCIIVNSNAQIQTSLDKSLRFLESSRQEWNLETQDLKDLIVSDRYTDEHNGTEHFYFQQSYKGIPIYNAITSVHIGKDGKIYDSPSRFVDHISTKINAVKAKITALDALKSSLSYYKVENAILPKLTTRSVESKGIMERTNFTHSDIPYRLVYFLTKENNLRLAWELNLELTDRSDYWSVRIDAVTGEILNELNFTIKCSFSLPEASKCDDHQAANVSYKKYTPVQEQLVRNNTTTTGAPVYNVIPFPTESPLHGPRKLVSNPADPIASKFGWHTTKSDGSADYTSTRGNNVNAYLDQDGNNTPDLDIASGGAALNFDFPFDQNTEPRDYTKATLTNLFYVCNMVHDITYGFGFNEVAGNFQVNTYGKGGATDVVLAEAQDGSGINNANFSTPSDGTNGRMQMYLWTAASSEVNVTDPLPLAGNISANRGNFGGVPTTTPIVSQVVWSDDGSSDSKLGCKNSQKVSKISGKIVMINRGTCEFGTKALYAQNAGAAAVIICGFDDQNVSMDGGTDGANVTIPTYYIRASICAKLKSAIDSGKLIITIVKPTGTKSGPDSLDGDFDNGIIAHEYGHGISTRLTGGPGNSGCVGNAESMGEGWSDFICLMTTAEAGDKSTDIRGIGNYATSGPVDGNGIRRRPYSTDMNINEFTYKDINAETHDLGEVWAAMLWDLYWAMADKYGYDPSFSNKNSGNNKAIQLVMDGMKLQPCSPGFVDGRNAILKADQMNNNGVNQCLIWDVFARRGVGFAASQGNSNLVGDEKEDFNSYPVCANATLVTKTATPLVKAGTDITYTITIRNLRAQKITNVNIIDNVPDGCTYVSGSANLNPTQLNGKTIIWNIASMDSVQTVVIIYRLKTDPGIFSNTVWIDNFENPLTEDNWTPEVNKGNAFWFWNDKVGTNDSHAWQVEAQETPASDVFLENNNEINLGNDEPALLFFQKYNTQANIDGGFLQVSSDNGQSYSLLSSADFAINGYNGNIDYSAVAIPKNKGFTGYTSEFLPSVLSLSAFQGKKIKLRFRFGNDDATLPINTDFKGWTIDDLEVINPVYYNSEVCVTTSLGETICTKVFGKGTLVDSKKIVAVSNPKADEGFVIFPNPAKNKFRIKFNENHNFSKVNITTISGQLLKSIEIKENSNTLELNAADFPKGLILIQLIGDEKTITKKLIIQG